MSVQVNHYILFGAVFPYADFRDRFDEFESYMDSAFEGVHHENGICVLSDGMDGKYWIIGRVLEKTRNHDGFQKPIGIFPDRHPHADEIEAKIESLTGTSIKGNGRFIVVSHYR